LVDITGKLNIIGLSPFNDRHIFEVINDSKISECTFYYYDKNEIDIIASLLNKKQLAFLDVTDFWDYIDGEINGEHYSRIKIPQKHKKTILKRISRCEFKKFADAFRSMTYSIMSDVDIVNQINNVEYGVRLIILDKIKRIKQDRTKTKEQQLVLQAVDFHIIAAEHNLDPAVIYCIGVDNVKNQKFMII